MSIEAIEKVHQCPLARKILELFAFLGQAPIPWDLVESWFSQSYPISGSLELGNALRLLCNYSMIQSPSPKMYTVHLLVQNVIRYQLPTETQRTLFEQALATITLRMEEFDASNLASWDCAKAMIPHATALFEMHTLMKMVDLRQQWKFMNCLGLICLSLGDIHDALKVQEMGLKIAQEWNQQSPETSQNSLATSYSNAGLSLSALGPPSRSAGVSEKSAQNQACSLWRKSSRCGFILQQCRRKP